MAVSDPSRMLTGVLLAGGRSRRMGGGDKCLRDLAGRPLLMHVIERLQPQVGALAINANGDPARFAAFGLPVVEDRIGGFAGPLAGIHAGMMWARSATPEARWIVTTSTDAPFLPLDLASRLLASADAAPGRIAVAASQGRTHPVIGLWPVALADNLETTLKSGGRKVLDWVLAHDNVVVDFPLLRFHGRMIDPFFNANTPLELDEARALTENRGEA